MRSTILLSSLAAGISAKSILTTQPQHIFSNPEEPHNEGYRIPSVRESTAMARKIMHLTTIGDLVTVFPSQSSSSDVELQENRPADVAGTPIGLMEYYADCDPHSGNPILLAINIATPYKNYNQGSNISLSVRWWPDRKTTYSLFNDDEEIPTPHTPAALPRFSLHGHLEPVSRHGLQYRKIQACFLRSHPDSVFWQPGNDISHESEYVQLIVDHVYWFGGFGDRARIGWLPIETWRNLTMEEIIDAKLPGEKKAKSWWKQWL
ncbi:hypothetical protein HII31_07339 [Pseudocercospora fuligena]|uniref:CREG-like beta-barrel domain-containing protein n=1 Tax=Pseudocercospora fuligena TaxID=685502 RepID=A0A8H6RJR0_9PEZI|nr:hypothetical protein HII31_07339 [Pseudocercospora fuligena]